VADPYREMDDVLGRSAREDDAVRALGAWRSRVRTTVLLVFCISGALAGIAGFIGVRALQFRLLGVAIYYVSAIGFVAPFLLLALIGLWVSRAVLRRRAPAAIEAIAARYEIDRTVLDEVDRAIAGL